MQFHKTANANCATFSTVIKLYTVHVQTTIADFKLISCFFYGRTHVYPSCKKSYLMGC